MKKSDLKTIMQKLGPIAKSSDNVHPMLQFIQFHLTSHGDTESGVLTATASNGYIASNLKFPIQDCNFDNDTDIFVPPFTIPTQPRGAFGLLPVTVTGHDIDFNFIDSHILQRLYELKPEEKPLDWSLYIPKNDPILQMGFSTKLTTEVLKSFLQGAPVCFNFYGPLAPVMLTQRDKALAMLLPVRIKPEDWTNNNNDIDEAKHHAK
jgi:hypothetical protein